MELVEGVFHQASCDGTEVAIIAYYPILLPASHVSKHETYLLGKIHSFRLTLRIILML